MHIEIYDPLKPSEENNYCVFEAHLENDSYVFFHMTPASNLDAIIANGFKSASELEVGELMSVSYAKKSFGCFANLGSRLDTKHVILAVRFDPVDLKEVVDNPSDIHVYKKHLQPDILGIMHLPAGFQLS